MFAQLLDTYPSKWDLWDVYVDAEKSQMAKREDGAKENVRRLYEDMTGSKAKKMRPKRAQQVFKAWLAWEEKEGGQKNVEHVKARAAEYVERAKKAKETEPEEE